METLKAWHIMRMGMYHILKKKFPWLSDDEIMKIIREVEEKCKAKTIEDFAGCFYSKLAELEQGGVRLRQT